MIKLILLTLFTSLLYANVTPSEHLIVTFHFTPAQLDEFKAIEDINERRAKMRESRVHLEDAARRFIEDVRTQSVGLVQAIKIQAAGSYNLIFANEAGLRQVEANLQSRCASLLTDLEYVVTSERSYASHAE